MPKAKVPKRSPIWIYFNETSGDLGKCTLCNTVISTKGGSTSNLRRHLKSKHKKIIIDKTKAGLSMRKLFGKEKIIEGNLQTQEKEFIIVEDCSGEAFHSEVVFHDYTAVEAVELEMDSSENDRTALDWEEKPRAKKPNILRAVPTVKLQQKDSHTTLEHCNEELIGQNINDSTVQNINDSAEQNINNPVEQDFNDPAEQNIIDSTEQNFNNPAEQNINDSTEQIIKRNNREIKVNQFVNGINKKTEAFMDIAINLGRIATAFERIANFICSSNQKEYNQEQNANDGLGVKVNDMIMTVLGDEIANDEVECNFEEQSTTMKSSSILKCLNLLPKNDISIKDKTSENN